MNIWTKPQFKTNSKKHFSKRDGTIAEIDTALDEYHGETTEPEKGTKLEALWGKLEKFEDEKKLKYANTIFVQSAKRKNAVRTLRTQVEWHMWQRKYDGKLSERTDLRDFFAKKRDKDLDDAVLRDWLGKLKVHVSQGDPVTSKLKTDLHAGIEEYFKPVGRKPWMDAVDNGPFPWKSGRPSQEQYLNSGPGYAMPSNLRIATVDFDSVVGNGAITYMRSEDMAKLKDEEKTAMFWKTVADRDCMVSHMVSVNQVAEHLSPVLRKLMEDYLRSLLTVDLELQSELVKRALKSDPGFRALVHLDYYATRAVDQVGLHKDTTGNNLFAVLNYINDDPMLGPEYIDDPAPFRTVNPGYYKEDRWSTFKTDVEWKRSGAPWAEIGDDKYVWPQPLLEALNKVRRFPPNDESTGKLASSVLPKDGLVSFVDELIFHATPIAAHRHDVPWANQPRYMHAGVSFPTIMKGKFPAEPKDILNLFEPHVKVDRIQRRMSAHYDQGKHIETGLLVPGAKSGGVRKFFRLWITIVPDHWYIPLPAFK